MSNTNIPKFASDLKILLSQQDQSIGKNDRIIGATKVYDYIYNNIEEYYRETDISMPRQKLIISMINKINEFENYINMVGANELFQNNLIKSMDKCKPILKRLFIQYVLNSPEYNEYDDMYKNMYNKCVSYFELNDSILRRSSRRKQLKYPNFIGMDDDNYDEENIDNKNKNSICSDSDSDYEDAKEKMKEKKLWSMYKRLNEGVTEEHIKIFKKQRKQMASLKEDNIDLARRSSRLINKPKKNYVETDDEM